MHYSHRLLWITSSIFFFFLLPVSIHAEEANPAEKPSLQSNKRLRFEVNFNSFREGETSEIGLISPALFKLKKNSRHTWSLFTSAGLHTLSNQQIQGQNNAEQELFNLEVMAGLFAQGLFYGDFLYQYGKVAVDLLWLNSKIPQNNFLIGAVFESGLEFRSSMAKLKISRSTNPLAINIGLRWRFAFDPLEGLQAQPDPIEGVSFVLGSRITF